MKRGTAFVVILALFIAQLPAIGVYAEERDTLLYNWGDHGIYLDESFLATIEPMGTLSPSNSGQGLAAKGKMVISKGTLDGEFETARYHLDTATGALSITGTGRAVCLWYDSNGQFIGNEIKSVVISEGITSLEVGIFANCNMLESVSLPSTLKTIGNYSFLNCFALTSVSIPLTTETIGEAAFANCTGMIEADIYGNIGEDAFNGCTVLENIRLHNGITKIEDKAFINCPVLASIEIPETVVSTGFGAFANCPKLTRAVVHGNLGESAFEACSNLTDLTISPDCNVISPRAFAFCPSLETAVIPVSVESLGAYAFMNCEKLISVSLPSTLTALGEYCFYKCDALRSIDVPDGISSIGEATFAYCTSLFDVELPNRLNAIGSAAFYECTALESIALPETCLSLGEFVFYNCDGLVNADMPLGLTTLNKATFYSCDKLERIGLPSSLNDVGSHVFTGCITLEEIVIPDSVKSIGAFTFAGCKSLKKLTLPRNLTEISEAMLYECSSLESLEIPGSVTEIRNHAFYDCNRLTAITFPQSIKTISRCAFTHCIALKEIRIPKNVTVVSEAAFMACESLSSVVIDGEVTSIESYAFADCGNLISFTIPSTVTSIMNNAFGNCANLSNVEFPDGLVSLGEGAYLNCPKLKSINIGPNVSSIGKNAFSGCVGNEGFSVDARNSGFKSVNGVLFNFDMSVLICYPSAASLKSYSLPTSVRSISESAFYYCSSLEEVTLTDDISEIPARVFFYCDNLKSVYIPMSVTSIGDYAFAGCITLENVNFNGKLSSLGTGAFLQCEKMKSFSLKGDITEISQYAFSGCGIETMAVPSGVTSIGDYAFAFCKELKELTLPDGLNDVGEYAFAECDRLAAFSIPQKVNFINNYAFYGCDSLAKVTLTGDVVSVGAHAFENDMSLANVYFYANAPKILGEDCFKNVPGDVVFHYNEVAEGFTTPEWIGPDKKVYRTATVATGDCGENLRWSLTTLDGVMTITGTGEMFDWSDSADVPWAKYSKAIEKVIIEEGVSTLGSRAFMSCDYLDTVMLPDTIVKSGYGVFADCISLNQVKTPNGLRDVGACMFYGCVQLTDIDFHVDVPLIDYYSFFKCGNLKRVIVPSKTIEIREGAFADCVSMEEIVLQGNLEVIGSGAFLNDSMLNDVYLLSSAPKNVEPRAFSGCPDSMTVHSGQSQSPTPWADGDGVVYETVSNENLLGKCSTNVDWKIMPEDRSITITGNGPIPDYELNKAPWADYSQIIEKIIVEEGVTRLGDFSFVGMVNATLISLPSTLKQIGEYALSACSSLEEIALPSGLTVLEQGAMSGCSALINVELPSGIVSIEPYVFSLCSNLVSVTSTAKLSSIGYGAFYACINMTDVPLNYGLETIGEWSFAHCASVSEIDIPNSVFSIGEYAFYHCSGLTKARIGEGISSVEPYVFSQTAISEIEIPANVQIIGEGAFELCGKLSFVTIHDDVASIGDSAFYGCVSLSGIDLKSVYSIGDMAFAATGIESVTIPKTVTNIGFYVFADCRALRKIDSLSETYPSRDGVLYSRNALLQCPAAGGKNVKVPNDISSIAEGAFYGCGVETIELGQQVTDIGSKAFALCQSLTDITLGGGISIIPQAAFGGCTNLSSVRFNGDAPVTIGVDAFADVSDDVTLYYLSNSEGWTEGRWLGPDGKSYATVRKMADQLKCEDICVTIGDDGQAYADLVLTNVGNTPLTINNVTVDNSDFTVDCDDYPVTIGAGQSDGSYHVHSVVTLDKNCVSSCIARVTWDEGFHDVNVSFVPEDYAFFTVSVLRDDAFTQGERYVATTRNNGFSDAPVRIVVAAFDGGRMILSENTVQTLKAKESCYITFDVVGLFETSCRICVYVLDANTLAPLADVSEYSSPVAIMSPQGLEAGISLVDIVHSETEEAAQKRTRFLEKREYEISETIIAKSLYDEQPGLFTESFSQTEYVFPFDDIIEFRDKIINGEEIKPEEIPDSGNRPSINVSGGVSLFKKSLPEPLEASVWKRTSSFADNEGRIVSNTTGTIEIATASFNASTEVSLANWDKRSGFKAPTVKGGATGSFVLASAQRDKTYMLGAMKVNWKGDMNVISGEVKVNGELTNQGFEITGAVGVDAANLNNSISIGTTEYTFLTVMADIGVGAGAQATGKIKDGKIRLKVGAKAGLGGNLGLEINVGDMLKACSAWMGEQIGKIKYQTLLIKDRQKDGTEKPLLLYGYICNDEGEIVDSWPVAISRAVTDSDIYSDALKLSNGGQEMPSEEKLSMQSGTGGGGQDTSVPGNELTNQQIADIASIVANAGIIPTYSKLEQLINATASAQVLIRWLSTGLSYTTH